MQPAKRLHGQQVARTSVDHTRGDSIEQLGIDRQAGIGALEREERRALGAAARVVEAIVRSPDAADARGGTGLVPGIGVTRRAAFCT